MSNSDLEKIARQLRDVMGANNPGQKRTASDEEIQKAKDAYSNVAKDAGFSQEKIDQNMANAELEYQARQVRDTTGANNPNGKSNASAEEIQKAKDDYSKAAKNAGKSQEQIDKNLRPPKNSQAGTNQTDSKPDNTTVPAPTPSPTTSASESPKPTEQKSDLENSARQMRDIMGANNPGQKRTGSDEEIQKAKDAYSKAAKDAGFSQEKIDRNMANSELEYQGRQMRDTTGANNPDGKSNASDEEIQEAKDAYSKAAKNAGKSQEQIDKNLNNSKDSNKDTQSTKPAASKPDLQTPINQTNQNQLKRDLNNRRRAAAKPQNLPSAPPATGPQAPISDVGNLDFGKGKPKDEPSETKKISPFTPVDLSSMAMRKKPEEEDEEEEEPFGQPTLADQGITDFPDQDVSPEMQQMMKRKLKKERRTDESQAHLISNNKETPFMGQKADTPFMSGEKEPTPIWDNEDVMRRKLAMQRGAAEQQEQQQQQDSTTNAKKAVEEKVKKKILIAAISSCTSCMMPIIIILVIAMAIVMLVSGVVDTVMPKADTIDPSALGGGMIL